VIAHERAARVPRCPLCGSTDAALQRTRRFAGIDFEHRYWRCGGCGCGYVHPVPPATVLEAIYDRAYYGHATEGADQADLNSYDERLGRMASLVGGPGRILDVGAGTGIFLERAIARGWRGAGVELSPFSAGKARAAGLEIVEAPFETADLSSLLAAGPFDAVHAWAVFEHFVDPVAAVRRAHTALRPGGVLAIKTINAGSLNARYYGADWEYNQDAGHLVFPTDRSMRELFRREGFAVRAAQSSGNPVGVNRLSATDNTRGVKSPALKAVLKGVQRRVLGNRLLRRLAREVVQRLHLGDAFTFYLEKTS
jgi:SAM-dependent methyltransferase